MSATDRYDLRCSIAVIILCSDRRVWAKEEDDAIRELVAKYGTKTWSVIAEQIVKDYNIEGRTGKQCRERWHNHLGIYLAINVRYTYRSNALP
jgi:molybdopterin biosynthesis enzyme MoaB